MTVKALDAVNVSQHERREVVVQHRYVHIGLTDTRLPPELPDDDVKIFRPLTT